MSDKLLTKSDLAVIETCFHSGTLTDEDIGVLICTCRHFLSGTNGGSSPDPLESSIPKAAGPSTIPSNDDTVEIFTDGACEGNPGPGGWGAIIKVGSEQREFSGGDRKATNNRMELMGAIQALSSLSAPSKVILTTDSQYLRNGITNWIHGWKKNGWRTSDKKPVKNKDIWLELDELNQKHQIEWKWVKGHNGHPENERCDELARGAILGLLKID